MANENNLLAKGLGAGVMQLVGDFQLVDASGNNLFAVAAATGNVSCAGTITSAGSADNNGNLTIANSAPFLELNDTTGSAKSLLISCDANKAQLMEAADSAGALLVLDLANHRMGVKTASPSATVDVTGTITASGLVTSAGFTSTGTSSKLDLSATSAGNAVIKFTETNVTPTVAWTDSGSSNHAPTTAPHGYLQVLVGSTPYYIPVWA